MTTAPPNAVRPFPPLSTAYLLLLILMCSIPLAIITPHGDQAWKMHSEIYRVSPLAAIFITVVNVLSIGMKLFGLAVLSSMNVAVCLAALTAVAIDLAYRQRRDWLHYFAVIAITLDVL